MPATFEYSKNPITVWFSFICNEIKSYSPSLLFVHSILFLSLFLDSIRSFDSAVFSLSVPLFTLSNRLDLSIRSVLWPPFRRIVYPLLFLRLFVTIASGHWNSRLVYSLFQSSPHAFVSLMRIHSFHSIAIVLLVAFTCWPLSFLFGPKTVRHDPLFTFWSP